MSIVGPQLHEIFADLRSISIGGLPMFPLSFTTKVLIVGATCAGKSTLGRALRHSPLDDTCLIELPRRLITRPGREDDDPSEVECVTREEFERNVESNALGIYWERPMEGDRVLRYGCRKPVHLSALPIYLGGNGLYDNANSVGPPGALDHALFIGVSAPQEVRRSRLISRSPALVARNPDEAVFRLAFRDESMVPFVHLVVSNWGEYELISESDVVTFIERLIPYSSQT